MNETREARLGLPRKAATTIVALVVGSLVAACGSTQTSPSPSTGASASVAPSATIDVATLRPVEGFTFITRTAAEDPIRHEQAKIIVEAWKAAGIPVTLTPLTTADLGASTFTSKNYEVADIQFAPTLERLDPEDFLGRFYSANAGPQGSNVSGFQNADYDALYEQQATASDDATRLQAVLAAQGMIYEMVPARPVIHYVTAGAYNSRDWTGLIDSVGSPVRNFWNVMALTPTGDRRTLVLGDTTGWDTLNPALVATVDNQFPLSLIYDSLVRIGPDGKAVPWAATSYTVNGNQVTAELRAGMTFHDGQPVTAEDVAFSITYLRDNQAPLFATKLALVESAVAEGNNVVITLKAPSASFVPNTLGQLPILPKHIWQDVTDPTAFANETPIGSGPFTFVTRQLGAQTQLARYDDYFSPAKADGVVYLQVGGLDALIAGMQQHEIDVCTIASAASLDPLKGSEGVTIVTGESHGWIGIHFNNRIEPFNDRHFRLALSYLVPVEDEINIVLNGQGSAAGSVIAPTSPWTDPSLAPFMTDVDKAMSELAAAGYVFGPDGTLYYPPASSDNRIIDSDPDRYLEFATP